MKTISKQLLRGASVALIAFAGLALAQDQPPVNDGGWRKFGDPTPGRQVNNDSRSNEPDAPQASPPRDYSVPPQLTLRQGTFITIRTNEMLSSDRNQAGDSFTATLERPLVVDGVVVAMRGQTIAGRVVDAQKAGRVQGTSKLSLELTDLTLADGQQVSIRSQMLARNGDTSVGRDVGTVAGTTATGAAIGAAAGWGRGAAIGAGAGAAVGLAGVLLTRGQPTVVYPESVMTFRIEAPVTISTDRAPQAFRFAGDEDYGRQPASRPPPSMYQRSDAGAPPPPPAYYGPGYDPYYYGYSPYYYGPSVGIYVGPRYGGYYGRGYSRGGFRR